MNVLTLDIKDPAITKKFNEQRCQNFAAIHKPVSVIFSITVILSIIVQWEEFKTG